MAADGIRSAPFSAGFGQLLVFCFVGLLLVAVYFVFAYLLSAIAAIRPPIASVFAYVSMIPMAYFAHRVVTFRWTGLHKVALPRFVVSSAIGIALSYAIPYFAIEWFAAANWLTFLLVCVVVPAFSFVSMRVWVFAKSEPLGAQRVDRERVK